MQAIDKELRKNGLAPAGHRHYEGNRKIIGGLIEMMIRDAMENGDVPSS